MVSIKRFLHEKSERSQTEGTKIVMTRLIIHGATDIGQRPYQEDNFIIQKAGDGRFHVAAVMDGHNGAACSIFLKQHLINHLNTILYYDTVLDIRRIEQCLSTLHKEWQRSPTFDASGSTLNGAIIDRRWPTRIYVFNLGDSQSVIFTKSHYLYHPLHDLSESRQRAIKIQNPTAIIKYDQHNVLRVCGNRTCLNLSGAYGNMTDHRLSASLLRKPEVLVYEHTETENFDIVIGTDGLWDELGYAEVNDHIRTAKPSSNNLAKHLIWKAQRRGRKGDNITIIMIRLDKSTLPLSHSMPNIIE